MSKKRRGRMVLHDDRFDSGSRQIKVQPAGREMYDGASWIVASPLWPWGKPWVTYMPYFGGRRHPDYRTIQFDPVAIDVTPHLSFCAADMPPWVYADWLEENGFDLPPAAFEVLRFQTVEVSR